MCPTCRVACAPCREDGEGESEEEGEEGEDEDDDDGEEGGDGAGASKRQHAGSSGGGRASKRARKGLGSGPSGAEGDDSKGEDEEEEASGVLNSEDSDKVGASVHAGGKRGGGCSHCLCPHACAWHARRRRALCTAVAVGTFAWHVGRWWGLPSAQAGGPPSPGHGMQPVTQGHTFAARLLCLCNNGGRRLCAPCTPLCVLD